MAGDWIKWQKGLARKPEVIRMAEILNRTRHEVAALLMEVWEWADDNVSSTDCVTDLSRSDRDDHHASVTLGDHALQHLDALAGVPGFANSMTAVGWLRHRRGQLEFPNYSRHNGKTARDRALASLRQADKRGRDTEKSVTKKSRLHRDKSVTREEKNSSSSLQSEEEPPLPPELSTPQFAAKWHEWVQYRKELKHKLTPTTIRLQLTKLEELGHDLAIETIDFTMTKGWRGLVSPRENERSSKTAAVDPDELTPITHEMNPEQIAILENLRNGPNNRATTASPK